jgi:hypothetical protein
MRGTRIGGRRQRAVLGEDGWYLVVSRRAWTPPVKVTPPSSHMRFSPPCQPKYKIYIDMRPMCDDEDIEIADECVDGSFYDDIEKTNKFIAEVEAYLLSGGKITDVFPDWWEFVEESEKKKERYREMYFNTQVEQ